MTKNKQNRLLEKNNIRASVLTDWTTPTAKFIPRQSVKVTGTVCMVEQGRYRKYAGQRGTVVAVSSRDGIGMRTAGRQYTRYFVAFPELGNKVVGLHSHYLRAVKA